ncbi:hypothetical protein ABZ442_30470 [Streptomyces triculaminicus]|uniref:hypothetical protein n=1 Tax=Streptomyces triculaminicus TaxID=2816232 RepID=UPI0033C2FA21
MLKTLREQYIAGKEQERAIRAERWAQEKQWREEDRAAQLKAQKDNSIDVTQHAETMRTAAGVSYLTLVCHEDTWTLIAIEAFSFWRPHWDNSELNKGCGPGSHSEYCRIVPDPNLRRGRITKLESGMQSVVLSGHNLVRILDALSKGTTSDNLAHAGCCKTLYTKLAGFVAQVDPSLPAGQSTGIEYRIDDSVRPESGLE